MLLGTLKRIQLILCVICLGMTMPAQALLHLELTQGMRAAQPIVMMPFAGDALGLPKQLQPVQVVADDLRHSGRVRLLPNAGAKVITDPKQLDLTHWRKQGADVVVLGQVQKDGSDAYKLSITVVDPYQKNQPEQFSVSSDRLHLRASAHRLSNFIYHAVTGVKGDFDSRIAYIRHLHERGHRDRYALMVADSDGFTPRAMLWSYLPIMSPRFAPDGKQMAYVSFEKHRARIFVQDLKTGQRHVLARFPGINGAPAWSPDGQKMAIVLSKTGVAKVYLLDIQRETVKQFTHGYAIDTEPAWAPDGQSIVFTSNRGGGPQLYRRYLDGRVERVTYDGNYNASGQFLHDGSGLVMLHRAHHLFSIAKLDFATGQVNVLARTGMDESPSVSPNDQMVLYATQYAGRGALAMVSIDGAIKLRLPSKSGDLREPDWGR